MRKPISKIALTATLALALTFTFSCSSDENGNNNGSSGSNYSCQLSTGACIQTVTVSDCSLAGGSVVDVCQVQNNISSSSGISSSSVFVPNSSSSLPLSSNGVASSSSVTPSSSSLAPRSSPSSVITTFTDSRDGKVYKKVTIGTQTWMAENLNFGNTPCYRNLESNCTTYGRLYDLGSATRLPNIPSEFFNPSASKYRTGVCPLGWHIPTDEEWSVLMKFVNPSCTNNSNCAIAGTKLKSASGWNEGGNGTDDLGFSALPGGTKLNSSCKNEKGDPVPGSCSYIDAGNVGYYFGTSKNNASLAVRMYYNSEDLTFLSNANQPSSVRCVQDDPNSPSTPPSNSSTSVTIGTFTDSRDGKVYRMVTIGTQTWMAENLNYNANGSKCYENMESNFTTHGRLYDWTIANTVCPTGWHLPSYAEWDALTTYVESDKGCSFCDAEHLKAKSGWVNSNGLYGNGLDSYSFAALPGGLIDWRGNNSSLNVNGWWWSASSGIDDGVAVLTMNQRLTELVYDTYGGKIERNDYYDYVVWGFGEKRFYHSVRCLQD